MMPTSRSVGHAVLVRVRVVLSGVGHGLGSDRLELGALVVITRFIGHDELYCPNE